MILPESLHPSISRKGFGYNQHVPLSDAAPGDFVQTADGLWLSQLAVAENSFITARTVVGKIAVQQSTASVSYEAGAEALLSANYDADTGCWLPEGFTGDEHTEALWGIAEVELDPVLNPASLAVKDQLKICEGEDCLNTRHYDFTHRLKHRTELLQVTPEYYREMPDGRIQTIWGDVLPPLADSIVELRRLQRLCPPYASEETSPLTANGISKITIEPATGCWSVRSYYTKPEEHPGWQFDGYGRLTLRRHIDPNALPARTGAQMLAHRVIWVATGRTLEKGKVLNHLCGFRPCGNPLHIVQVGQGENIRHRDRMQKAIAESMDGH